MLVSKNNLVKQSDERDSCFWNLTGIRRHRLRALFGGGEEGNTLEQTD